MLQSLEPRRCPLLSTVFVVREVIRPQIIAVIDCSCQSCREKKREGPDDVGLSLSLLKRPPDSLCYPAKPATIVRRVYRCRRRSSAGDLTPEGLQVTRKKTCLVGPGSGQVRSG